jgi:hyaluronoglucosaminidase
LGSTSETTPIAGVIEGFYGRPWSWRERERMADFMAANALNFLAYAPKNDPLHRDRWREPYLPDEVERFHRFARRCDRLGIEFAFGVSPLRFDYSSGTDFDLLWDKLATFAAAGIRSFGLLMDDMPAADAAAQVELVNRIWEGLRDVGADRLTFTPTEYCGSGCSPYLEALGQGLHQDIDVFWTGPAVCSPELTFEHACTVATTLRRQPIFWDNYPVNDLEMRHDPHLHPLTGRDPELFNAAKGVVWAAGIGAEMPKVALATCAEYAADPAAYDAASAWLKALLALTGDPEDARALALLAQVSWRSALEPRPLPPTAFSAAAERFWLRWDAGQHGAALADMRVEVAALKAAGERLRRLANPRLRREVRPWATKLIGWADVAALALDRLETGDPVLRRLTLERIQRNRANFAFVLGDQVEVFARRCMQLLRPVLLASS